MADTSELLRICDEVLTLLKAHDLPDDERIVVITRALKSRLQAEAPEDAEVRVVLGNGLEALTIQKLEELAGIKPRSTTSQAEAQAHSVTREQFYVTLRDYRSREGGRIPPGICGALADELAALLPTPAPAPVLTEEERKTVEWIRVGEWVPRIKAALAIIDRLTQPTPAS